MAFRHLFDIALEYKGPVQDTYPSEGIGQPVGGGVGTIAGADLRGKLRWALFERQRDNGTCDANHTGVIETEDGQQVQFHTLGFYRQLDAKHPSRWRFSGGVRFQTEDPKFQWLTQLPAVLEGEVDLETGQTRAQAFALQGPTTEV